MSKKGFWALLLSALFFATPSHAGVLDKLLGLFTVDKSSKNEIKFSDDQIKIFDSLNDQFFVLNEKLFDEKGNLSVSNDDAYKLVAEEFSQNKEEIQKLPDDVIKYFETQESKLNPDDVVFVFQNTVAYIQRTKKLIGKNDLNVAQSFTPPTEMRVSEGWGHACAIIQDCYGKKVSCWGHNTFGQLGDGTLIDKSIPVDVVGLPGIPKEVSVGDGTSCAITANGSNDELYCWGYNFYGELGNGTTVNSSTPQLVQGLAGIPKAIAAGGDFACALVSSYSGGPDEVRCWGHNNFGQIGIGSWAVSPTARYIHPEVVRITGTPKSISVGLQHACSVVTNSGTDSLQCWGYNKAGQIGNGTLGLGTNQATPVSINLAGTPTDVFLGHWHSCALLSNGTLQCWGDNEFGELGIGSSGTGNWVPLPATVSVPGNISTMSLGSSHTCAISSGNLYCWGSHSKGELGIGATGVLVYPTVQSVPQLSNPLLLEVGDETSCAISRDSSGNDSVNCWGNNEWGQVGIGNTTHQFTPQTVTTSYACGNLIAASDYTTCAVTSSRNVKCWGDNGQGQAGRGAGSPGQITTAEFVLDTSGSPVTNVTSIAAGQNEMCAIQNGQTFCWGENGSRIQPAHPGSIGTGNMLPGLFPNPTQVFGLNNNVTAISVGFYTGCAIKNGQAFCWGDNDAGQVGNPAWGAVAGIPVTVVGSMFSGVTSISVGDNHTCAIQNGNVWCWGYLYGGLGLPVMINGISLPAIKVASGTFGSSCAVLTDGSVSCWTPGNSPSTIISSGVKDISSNTWIYQSHSCALMNTGTVKCWGSNTDGELGNGTTTSSSVPVDVLNPSGTGLLTDVVGIATGYFHSCATLRTGGAVCWGVVNHGSNYGALGNGSTSASSPLPTQVLNFP